MKRGGSWNSNANNCRVANRNNNWPDNENNNLGFRLVSTTHGKDALSHPRPPAPRASGDEHGQPVGASTPTHKRSGERPNRLLVEMNPIVRCLPLRQGKVRRDGAVRSSLRALWACRIGGFSPDGCLVASGSHGRTANRLDLACLPLRG